MGALYRNPRHASTARTLFDSPSTAGRESTGFDTIRTKRESLNHQGFDTPQKTRHSTAVLSRPAHASELDRHARLSISPVACPDSGVLILALMP